MTYTAEISGSSWRTGPQSTCKTLREARAFAESYGTTADRCTVRDAQGRIAATYLRDKSGRGLRWFKSFHHAS